MVDTPRQSTEALRDELTNSRVFHSCAELLAAGYSQMHLEDAATQISQMIDQHNALYQHEMLPKTPSTIIEQFTHGNSVIVAIPRLFGGLKVVCHGTNYDNFEDGEENVLGMQVEEVGSLIVAPDYRGLGVGTHGTRELIRKAQSRSVPTLALATVKKKNTLHVFEKAGFTQVSYWEFPYLTFLTCTCGHCSEREGHQSCGYRRGVDVPLDFAYDDQKIPCSVVVSDVEQARVFENRCAELHQAWSGRSMQPNVINVESMQEAAAFFDYVKELANAK